MRAVAAVDAALEAADARQAAYEAATDPEDRPIKEATHCKILRLFPDHFPQ